MKLSERDQQKLSDVIVRINNGFITLKEYTPIMVFQNEGDEDKVKKGLDILEKKLQQIRYVDGYKELKKVIKIKKIVKEDELYE